LAAHDMPLSDDRRTLLESPRRTPVAAEVDVLVCAGLPFNVGRDSDGLAQPLTLMFEVEGVESFVQNGSIELYDKLAKAIADHHLDTKLPFNRVDYAPWIIRVPPAGLGSRSGHARIRHPPSVYARRGGSSVITR